MGGLPDHLRKLDVNLAVSSAHLPASMEEVASISGLFRYNVYGLLYANQAVFPLAKFVSKTVSGIAPRKHPPYLPLPPWVMQHKIEPILFVSNAQGSQGK